ncbi:DUF1700 domain-containing protein [Companilactobacillus mishanensis]|uniref:DUF1700 domain-containing protein n=1 Tax=Companilactobacillus mishanensis TaxID=2486008 RepID=A0ABW9PA83_9LACO|nr:DUF1700 domain-containing protein [Companilactobacillus mishanensis]MQS46044.1 DUF1700 domain-containing protein [Companilactobacillus mishanensis]
METNAIDSYINEFSGYLKQLDSAERDDVLEFYREYIIDAHLNTTNEITNELGTPKKLARKVLADYSIKMSEDDYKHLDNGKMSGNDKAKRNIGMIGVIILALLATPVAIPVALILILLVLLAAGLAIFFVLLFVFLVALSVILGIGSVVMGIAIIFQSAATSIFYIGVGIAIIGADFIFIPLIISFLKWCFDVLVMFFRWVGKKLLHGRNTKMKGADDNA